MKTISQDKVSEFVKKNNLTIYKGVWHYSYNFTKNNSYKLILQFDTPVLICNNSFIHAPALIYTKANYKEIVKIQNSITSHFNSSNEAPRKVFWFLKISTLEKFLERRSKSSKKPRKHFPTSETYQKVKKKINCELEIIDYEERFFINNYNRLKKNDYLNASIIIENLKKSYPELPKKWMKLAFLKKESEVIAIALLIDDGKSISLENIAAERSSLSYGVYVCTEIIRYCADNNYYSFDAGVSGVYGVYKSKIFIDSYEIFNKKDKFIYSILRKIFKLFKNSIKE